jgi:2-oxoglutarate ferredoxin oxidoreductase subunit delta
MPTLQIETKGCRSCALCVDICPTQVFDLEPKTQVAQANRANDCIGCCSCEYICPSRCVAVTDVPMQLPFYRLDHAKNLVSRFLQQQPAQEQIDASDVQWALKDVKNRLRALGDSTTETMGRGLKVVGRTAGTLAAAHLPDMYEETSTNALLQRLQERFAGAFPFTFNIEDNGSVKFSFTNCAMKDVVQEAGGKVGADALCLLFHEYWAGLIGEFCKRKFAVAQDRADDPCSVSIEAK